MKIEHFKKLIREIVEEVLTTDDAHSSIENDPKVKLASRELAKAKIKKSEAEGRAAGAELTALKSTKSQTQKNLRGQKRCQLRWPLETLAKSKKGNDPLYHPQSKHPSPYLTHVSHNKTPLYPLI